MTTPPPQWGAPQQASPQQAPPQWGAPQQASPQWGAPQQTQASWGAPPPPQWGPPSDSPPPAPRSVVSTVIAHVVLWVGLAIVVFSYGPITRLLLTEVQLPYRLSFSALSVFALLPVAAAMVIAGRGALLRLAGALGALALLIGVGSSSFLPAGAPTQWLGVALAVLGLGTWITVRRHARLGYLVLIAAAVLAYLWFGPPGLDLRAYPYRHRFGATASTLWSDLPLLALALLGLVSSFVRPVPPPGRDGLAFAVVGGLIGLAAIAGVIVAVA